MKWLENLFTSKTPAQREKEQEEFDKKILPMGQPQLEAARGVLAVVLSKRLYESERMFTFISGKDKYIEGGKGAAGTEEAKKYLAAQKRLTPQDRVVLLEFIRLEAELESLENYPTPEQVLALAAIV